MQPRRVGAGGQRAEAHGVVVGGRGGDGERKLDLELALHVDREVADERRAGGRHAVGLEPALELGPRVMDRLGEGGQRDPPADRGVRLLVALLDSSLGRHGVASCVGVHGRSGSPRASSTRERTSSLA